MEMSFAIRRLDDPAEKSVCVRSVLTRLPAWFGDAAAVSGYADQAAGLACWAAEIGGVCAGILAAAVHYGHTGEVVVCGVLPEVHGRGIGTALYLAAEAYFRAEGYRYAVVKTLSDAADYAPYESTRRFYRRMGFEALLTLTEMWDEHNPCLVMLKVL
ncbi:MAG: GNAT family N-acetyltransferase [Candidatus Spyradocola sp.]